jgi:hypothetical protein
LEEYTSQESWEVLEMKDSLMVNEFEYIWKMYFSLRDASYLNR